MPVLGPLAHHPQTAHIKESRFFREIHGSGLSNPCPMEKEMGVLCLHLHLNKTPHQLEGASAQPLSYRKTRILVHDWMILGNEAKKSFWENLNCPPREQLSLENKQTEKTTEWASCPSCNPQQDKVIQDLVNTTEGSLAGTILKGLCLQDNGAPAQEGSVGCKARAKTGRVSPEVSQRMHSLCKRKIQQNAPQRNPALGHLRREHWHHLRHCHHLLPPCQPDSYKSPEAASLWVETWNENKVETWRETRPRLTA